MKRSPLICVLMLASAAGVLWSQSSIIAPDAKLELLSDGFSFTEGCTTDAAGNVYFTDQPNDRIYIWSVEGKLSTYMQGSGRANGMSFDKEGNLVVCADEKNELRVIDSSGKSSILVKGFNDKLLNGPNDVWINPKGGLYFTDPLYKRDYWKRSPASEQDTQGVYYLGPHYQNLLRVADDLKTPNGIIGSPDGKILYIADIGANKTFKYDIQPDGTLANKKLFCEMGSDGMTIDNEGNVYLSGMGVTIFNSEGKQIERIPVNSWVGNVCFGGADHQTLFITASKNLYSMRMRVKGVGSQ